MNVCRIGLVLAALCLLYPSMGLAVPSPLDSLIEDELLKSDVNLQEFDQPLPEDDANEQYRRGLMLLREKKIDEGKQVFNDLLKQDPKHIPSLIALAQIAYSQKEFSEAIRQTRRAIQIEPENARLHVGLAQIHVAQDKIPDAERAIKKAIELDPNDPNWRVGYAQLLLLQENSAGAEREILTAARLAPTNYRPQMILGNLYSVQGRTDDALRAYKEAISIDDRRPEPRLATALTLARNEDIDGALEQADALIQITTESTNQRFKLLLPVGYTLKGALFNQQNRIDDAIEQYKRATQANFRYVLAHLSLGNAYQQKQAYEKALESYQNALSVAPNNGRAYLMLGQTHLTMGNTEAAIETYEEILSLDPNVPVAQNNLAWLYADSGTKLEEAVKLAEAAKKVAPENSQILDTVGWVYYKKGDHQKALENIVAAVDAGANDPNVFYHLGLVHEAIGNTAKAEAAYQKVRELDPDFDKLK